MTTSFLLSAALSFTGGGSEIRVQQSPDATSIEVLSGDGEVTVEAVSWRDGEGRPRLDVVWPDGLTFAVYFDGDGEAVTETDDPAEAEVRLDDLLEVLEQAQPTGWGRCALHIAGTIAACGTSNILLCGVEAYALACECLPLVSKAEGECPGLG